MKNTSFERRFAMACVAIALVLTAHWSVLDGASASTPTYRDVEYRVEGTTRGAGLTYENDQGGTEQRDVQVPWKKSFTMQRGAFAYVSAQNSQREGTVICQIWVDGVQWRQSESSGAYVIADCHGRIE